jgi:type II secretory pathway component PulL
VKLELKKLKQKENEYQKKASEMFENLFPRVNKLEV